MKTKTQVTALTLATLLLAACSGVMNSAQPARQYYMLMPLSGSAVNDAGGQAPRLSMSLDAVPGLDTDRVQALGSDAQLNRYANARWPDHLPEVLTSVIQRSLASTGRFADVNVASRATGGNWFLQLEVQKFYGLQDAAGNTGSVTIALSGSIECGEHRAAFKLDDTVAVNAERLSEIVAAHQRGLDGVTQQLLNKISEACQ